MLCDLVRGLQSVEKRQSAAITSFKEGQTQVAQSDLIPMGTQAPGIVGALNLRRDRWPQKGLAKRHLEPAEALSEAKLNLQQEQIFSVFVTAERKSACG
jgi:hypothetical protein